MTALATTAVTKQQLLLQGIGLSLRTPAGRPLLSDLHVTLTSEHVALIGRNGVGKSTLLDVLAGHEPAHGGSLICHVQRLLVRQSLDSHAYRNAHESRGEHRRRELQQAFAREPELLLLDEPTQDLDQPGIDWLLAAMRRWRGGLVVVSHHRRLLRHFHHFVIVAESGCRYLRGSFEDIERELERQHDDDQRKYLRKLNVLLERERHNAKVCRRRRRKKNLGRLHEEGRAPSNAQLHGKKGYAQVSQGKAAKLRLARITGVRDWARAARRALGVQLPLKLAMPALAADDGRARIALEQVTVNRSGRALFQQLDLRVGRERLAIVGSNGAGKTTLLQTMLGQWAPDCGKVQVDARKLGSIAQGASDWITDDSLVDRLQIRSEIQSLEGLAQQLIAHRFPLALAQRPLRSLSPGERLRAALICLFQQAPAVDVLVLDEPTYSLDFVGLLALRNALAAWPGGLVIASHDQEFLAAIGIDRWLDLDALTLC